jgi:hypothetical protein
VREKVEERRPKTERECVKKMHSSTASLSAEDISLHSPAITKTSVSFSKLSNRNEKTECGYVVLYSAGTMHIIPECVFASHATMKHLINSKFTLTCPTGSKDFERDLVEYLYYCLVFRGWASVQIIGFVDELEKKMAVYCKVFGLVCPEFHRSDRFIITSVFKEYGEIYLIHIETTTRGFGLMRYMMPFPNCYFKCVGGIVL